MSLLETLLDRVRTAAEPQPATPSGAEKQTQQNAPAGPPGAPEWWQPLTAGALAATATWLLLALPALVVWVATPQTTVGWWQALGVASAGWYLGHGAHVTAGPVTISLTPLGVLLLGLVVATRQARLLLDRSSRSAPGTSWPAHLLRRDLPGFVGGYAGVGAVAGLLTLAGPARPTPLTVPLVLLVPVAALAWTLVGRHARGEDAGVVGEALDRLPRPVVRALRPGMAGAGLLLAVGLVPVLVMAVARWGTVVGVHAAVTPGLVGGIVLAAAQLLLVPNLAGWGLAWICGPGFQIADGSTVTLAGAHPGLMPMVPVLGALPTDGTWSRWLQVLLLLPVLAGGGIGWLACRGMARLASWRMRLLSAGSAAATSGLALTVLVALGSGSVGVDRLRDIGTRPWVFGPVLLAELLFGAAGYVLGWQLWLRLRPHG